MPAATMNGRPGAELGQNAEDQWGGRTVDISHHVHNPRHDPGIFATDIHGGPPIEAELLKPRSLSGPSED